MGWVEENRRKDPKGDSETKPRHNYGGLRKGNAYGAE